MKRIIPILCMVGLVLLSASFVAAQQSAQPVVRLGNWIEVGNEVFMHVIGTFDTRYRTTQNYDFQSSVRDRVNNRTISSSVNHEGGSDLTFAEVRIGADFRYQKSLTAQVLFEQQIVMDGQTIDGTANGNSPGGASIFSPGLGAQTENPGFHVERYWAEYKFAGTPLSMRIGADLWETDLARVLGDDDPRLAVFAKFGDIDLMAAAMIERESQRLGLTNDNDFVYYTFGMGYNFKPHQVRLDVQYFRDRFAGADVLAGGATGFRGQKVDAVGVTAGWKGKLGPVNGLLQGMLMTGTARGGTGFGLGNGVRASRDYTILGFGAVAHFEVDLGGVRPFIGAVFGSPDGDPRDNQLKGYYFQPTSNSSGIAGGAFPALDVSVAFGGGRDYSCPALLNGAAPRAGGNANLAIGNGVFNAVADQCSHTIDAPWNVNVGNRSHPGIVTTYSNPGTLALPIGVRIFPVKGHEISAFYVHTRYMDTALLEVAYNLPAGSIDNGQVHEIGGYWFWTPNPHFDIRLGGNAGFAAGGYKDLARLATCNGQPCQGDDVALSAEARFRARF